ncbi:hypothetical protein FQA39_LY04431 [Lamprigera yunnana]|nr:hypothetical protein FQA39_LY04431 [Lamprigera yunnana]
MKLLIVFLFFVVVYGNLPKDVIQNIRETVVKSAIECKDEIGASEDDIMPLIGYNVPQTEKGKCFVACMHKQFKLIDKDGNVDKSSWAAILNELKVLDLDTYKIIKPIAVKCLKKEHDSKNECDTAAKLLECLYKEGHCVTPRDPNENCIFEF